MTTDANSVVTFEYGTVLTQSIPPVVGVIGLPTEEPVGTPDAASNFNADGTISIYIDKSLVGNPQPGDFLGAVNGRTFNTGDTPPNTFQRSSLLIDHTFIKGNTDTSFPPATYTVVGNTSCPTATIVPVGAVSRKTHVSAGTYDVDLPLIGAPGVECRTGGPSGNHKVVVTFAHPVTIGGSTTPPPSAVTLNGTGSVSSITVNSSDVTINLTGVANAQNLGITLNSVSDGTNSGNVSITMGVLEGDTTANGKVNSSDISQTQSQSGQQVSLSNYREDVTVNGFINSSDISVVQSRSGTALP
jgi:hypothetical protein